MSESNFVGLLSNLVASGVCKLLHQRLVTFFDESYRNTPDENAATCCELIEEHAKLQGQLFWLLNLCSAKGSPYADGDVLKAKLLPWLGNGFVPKNGAYELRSARENYERKLVKLEEALDSAKAEGANLRMRLVESETGITRMKRQLKDGLRSSQRDIMPELRHKLMKTTVELEAERTANRHLAHEILELKQENSHLHRKLHKKLLSSVDKESPGFLSKSVDVSAELANPRSVKAVERFKQLYKNDRVDLMDTLKGLTDDDTSERLVYRTVEECFTVSRMEQRQMRNRMQQALEPPEVKLMSEERVDELVENYMKKSTENYDVETLIPDVMRALHRSSSSSPKLPCSEKLLVPFIREVLRVAWSLVSSHPPIDVAPALEGDVINESRHHRAYRSAFSANFVHHYVWPALLVNGRVVAKGVAVTRRLSARPRDGNPLTSSPLPKSADLPQSLSKDLGFSSLSSSWSS